MRLTRLGPAGPTVSALTLGTINLGTELDKHDSFRLLDAAVDLGITSIDTADIYGRRTGEGLTETLLGAWLAQSPAARSRVVIMTKLYLPFSEDVNDRGLNALHLRRGVDAALRRLGVDRVALLQFHHADALTRPEETWASVAALVAQGKVGSVGTSNHSAWQIGAAHAAARQQGLPGPVSEQSPYNLLNRAVEVAVVPACQAMDMGVLAWSPLARGLLAGLLDRSARGDTDGRLRYPNITAAMIRHRARLTSYRHLCDEYSLSPSIVAIAWLLGRPGLSSVVIGPRTTSQLVESHLAASVCLPSALIEAIDYLFPPGLPSGGPPHP